MRFTGEGAMEMIYSNFAYNLKKWKAMPKCPNCTAHTPRTTKEWNFGRFKVRMYKCTKCGNQFREHFKGGTLQFVLSAHNGGLGKIRVGKETTDRHKTYQ
jgi:transposase-like protein